MFTSRIPGARSERSRFDVWAAVAATRFRSTHPAQAISLIPIQPTLPRLGQRRGHQQNDAAALARIKGKRRALAARAASKETKVEKRVETPPSRQTRAKRL
jgi:hypothetical protein